MSPPPSIAHTDISTVTEAQQQVNAVRTDPVQLEILKILQQMQQNMATPQTTNGSSPTNRTPRKTLDNTTFCRHNTNKYCWTHGGCGHDSTTCRAKAPGHQETATFKNRMGGSNAHCPSTSWRGERVVLSNLINKCLNNTSCSSPTTRKDYIIAKGDSGASNHYFRPEDKRVLSNITPANGPDVHQPDSTVLTTEATGTVPIDDSLSADAKKAMILPDLKSASLISLGQLCNDYCLVVLSKKKLAVVKDNKIVLRWTRNKKMTCGTFRSIRKVSRAQTLKVKRRTRVYISPRTRGAKIMHHRER